MTSGRDEAKKRRGRGKAEEGPSDEDLGWLAELRNARGDGDALQQPSATPRPDDRDVLDQPPADPRRRADPPRPAEPTQARHAPRESPSGGIPAAGRRGPSESPSGGLPAAGRGPAEREAPASGTWQAGRPVAGRSEPDRESPSGGVPAGGRRAAADPTTAWPGGRAAGRGAAERESPSGGAPAGGRRPLAVVTPSASRRPRECPPAAGGASREAPSWQPETSQSTGRRAAPDTGRGSRRPTRWGAVSSRPARCPRRAPHRRPVPCRRPVGPPRRAAPPPWSRGRPGCRTAGRGPGAGPGARPRRVPRRLPVAAVPRRTRLRPTAVPGAAPASGRTAVPGPRPSPAVRGCPGARPGREPRVSHPPAVRRCPHRSRHGRSPSQGPCPAVRCRRADPGPGGAGRWVRAPGRAARRRRVAVAWPAAPVPEPRCRGEPDRIRRRTPGVRGSRPGRPRPAPTDPTPPAQRRSGSGAELTGRLAAEAGPPSRRAGAARAAAGATVPGAPRRVLPPARSTVPRGDRSTRRGQGSGPTVPARAARPAPCRPAQCRPARVPGPRPRPQGGPHRPGPPAPARTCCRPGSRRRPGHGRLASGRRGTQVPGSRRSGSSADRARCASRGRPRCPPAVQRPAVAQAGPAAGESPLADRGWSRFDPNPAASYRGAATNPGAFDRESTTEIAPARPAVVKRAKRRPAAAPRRARTCLRGPRGRHRGAPAAFFVIPRVHQGPGVRGARQRSTCPTGRRAPDDALRQPVVHPGMPVPPADLAVGARAGGDQPGVRRQAQGRRRVEWDIPDCQAEGVDGIETCWQRDEYVLDLWVRAAVCDVKNARPTVNPSQPAASPGKPTAKAPASPPPSTGPSQDPGAQPSELDSPPVPDRPRSAPWRWPRSRCSTGSATAPAGTRAAVDRDTGRSGSAATSRRVGFLRWMSASTRVKEVGRVGVPGRYRGADGVGWFFRARARARGADPAAAAHRRRGHPRDATTSTTGPARCSAT